MQTAEIKVKTKDKPEVSFTVDLPETPEEFVEKGGDQLVLAQDEYLTRASNSARAFYREGRSVKEIQEHLDTKWKVGGRREQAVHTKGARIIKNLPPEAQEEAMRLLEELANLSK